MRDADWSRYYSSGYSGPGGTGSAASLSRPSAVVSLDFFVLLHVPIDGLQPVPCVVVCLGARADLD